MIYSCHYPITHQLVAEGAEVIDYAVLLNNVKIYEGFVSSYSAVEGLIEIDLSDIFRVYLQTYYEQLSFSGLMTGSVPTQGTMATLHTFVVQSDYNNKPDENGESTTGADMDYPVMYDYNREYILEYPNSGIRNYPISTVVDPRQYMSVVSYNTDDTDNLYYSVNGSARFNYYYSNNLYHYLLVKPGDIGASGGDTVLMSGGGETLTYQVKENCRNRFALYYVNLLGGLDTLLCAGKHVESFGVSRTDAELYNNRKSRRDFQQVRIYQEIRNNYLLHTDWLQEELADRIDHLIYSPKVWIHDLEKDLVTSCLIEDSSYTVKSFKNDRLVYYAINVTESQNYIVR